LSKARSNDGLGSEGRGEAATATVTVLLRGK
jgi:2C-methyl-D-erythritol 2,4-cyclodiphosphate synthase